MANRLNEPLLVRLRNLRPSRRARANDPHDRHAFLRALACIQISISNALRYPHGVSWFLWLSAFAAAVLFVAFSWLFVLVEHADHGGDFGQYVVQARNLVEGRPWSHLMEGYPAILPGYPAILAIATAIAGIDFKVYGLINSVAWACTALLCLYYYRERFFAHSSAFTFYFCVLLCPLVMALQADVQPNILFAFAVTAALVAADKLRCLCLNPLMRARWAVVLMLPAVVRIEAIALYGALAMSYVLARRFALVFVCVAGVLTTIALDVAIAVCFDQESNFGVVSRQFERGLADDRTSQSLESALNAFAYMGTTYIEGLPEISVSRSVYAFGPEIRIAYDENLVAATFLPAILLLGFCVAGAWIRSPLTVDKIYFVLHIAMLSMFLLEGGARLRYLLPILPIFWFYIISGMERIAPPRIPRNSVGALIAGLLAFPVFLGAWEQHELPARGNVTHTQEMIEVVQWISANDAGAGVAYFKPRPMTMLLDGKAPSVPVKNLRTIGQVREYLERPNFLIVVRKIRSFGQRTILDLLRRDPRAEVVLDNKEMIIFRVRSTDQDPQRP